MQSHRTLSTEADLLAEARKFREEKLPCDAMIYLGTGFTPVGWNNGHNSFDLNSKVFEHDPATVLKDFHALNFHVVVHIVPQNLTTPAYRTLHGQIPPAADETVDQTDIGPYWQKHQALFAAGIDGWWPDEGDWFDLPSRLARHRMYYQGPLSDKPNVRPGICSATATPAFLSTVVGCGRATCNRLGKRCPTTFRSGRIIRSAYRRFGEAISVAFGHRPPMS